MVNERLLKLYSAVDSIPQEINASDPQSEIKCKIRGDKGFILGLLGKPVRIGFNVVQFKYIGEESILSKNQHEESFTAEVVYSSMGRLKQIRKKLKSDYQFK